MGGTHMTVDRWGHSVRDRMRVMRRVPPSGRGWKSHVHVVRRSLPSHHTIQRFALKSYGLAAAAAYAYAFVFFTGTVVYTLANIQRRALAVSIGPTDKCRYEQGLHVLAIAPRRPTSLGQKPL